MAHRYYSLVVLLLLTLASPALQAQDASDFDQLVLTRGDVVRAHIVEVLPEAVKYRLADEPDGPLYSIPKSDVRLVIYRSGRTEEFASAPSDNGAGDEPPQAAQAEASSTRQAASQPISDDPARAQTNRIEHVGLGLQDVTGDQDFAVLFDGTSNAFVRFAEGDKYVVGLGLVFRSYLLSYVENYVGGSNDIGVYSVLLGPNVTAEYLISERISVFGSLGAGPLYSRVVIDEESASDWGFEEVLSSGAAFWFSDRWGAHAKALLGDGDAAFTIGVSRRNW